MELDEKDLRAGLKFIVGAWEADYVVNMFSNDLAHIPAAELKSPDGKDLTALRFEFFEDHTINIEADGKKHGGKWEQESFSEFRFMPDVLEENANDEFVKAVEKLSMVGGDHLVFSLGFLAIALRKVAEGHITEAPDIGDMAQTEEDLCMDGIVGIYVVEKGMAFVDGDFGLFTRPEVEAFLEKQIAAGETDAEAADEQLKLFKMQVEFTPEHRVVTWMPLPPSVDEAEIRAAIEAGQIKAVRDGLFAMGGNEWKAVGGKYYYNTGEQREVFGEEQSPWDELSFDENGLLPFSSGMVLLKKE
jgi:hypothetical protein